MSQMTTLDKFNSGKSIIDNMAKIKFRDAIHPALLELSKTNIKYKIVKDNICHTDKDIPAIYVANHYSAQDTPIICNAIDRRAYILAGEQNLRRIDELFFKLNGVIFVDRKNKEDMQLAKKAMEAYIMKKQNLIVFPEATWNLSPESLMLWMKWGIIEVAQNTGAQIVPINFEYDKISKECHVYYENPIYINKGDSKADCITRLRDLMATARWYRMECNQSTKFSKNDMNQMFSDLVAGKYTLNELELANEQRLSLNIDELRAELMSVVTEYPLYDLNYEQSIVYHPYPTPDEVFEPLKKMKLKMIA